MAYDEKPLHFDIHGMRERERVADALEKKLDHELEISEKSDVAGRVGTNASSQNSAKQAELSKKKQKEAQERFEAAYLAMLNDYGNYLDGQIKYYEDQMSAHDVLQDMHDKGLLDPDNPDHDIFFNNAGMDKDDYRLRGQDALDDNKIRIDGAIDDYSRKKDTFDRGAKGDMDAVQETLKSAREDGFEVAGEKLINSTHGNEFLSKEDQIDARTAQVEPIELKEEVREQLDYSAEEVEREEIISEQKAADGSDLGGFSLESLMASENPISTPHTPTQDFNTVAKDVVAATASLETDMQADHSANINAPEQAEIPLSRTL